MSEILARRKPWFHFGAGVLAGVCLGVVSLVRPGMFAFAAAPSPFLYPPYLGQAVSASSIFDHTAPKYTSETYTERHRITTFTGAVTYCATDTPTPTGFAPTPGATPTQRCRSGVSYGGVAYDGHNGIDYVIRYQPIAAAADTDSVERAGWRSTTDRRFSYGLYTVLQHPNGYRTLYGHLSSLNVAYCLIGPCSFPHGTVIGVSGNTGSSSGAHLHFSVFNAALSGTNDVQASVVDPYGWTAGGTPVWGNNQSNSLWVQRPHVGANPAILPGGTALPNIVQAPNPTILDDGSAVVNNTSCTWTVMNNAVATNGQMRYVSPSGAGSDGCYVRWNVPASLPAGVYQVWVRIPNVSTWTNDQYSDGAIFGIQHHLENSPTTSKYEQAIVSEQEAVVGAGYLSDHKMYVGSYFFAGGNSNEYVYLGNVVAGVVSANTRLLADSVILAPERLAPTPTATRTRTPTPTATLYLPLKLRLPELLKNCCSGLDSGQGYPGPAALVAGTNTPTDPEGAGYPGPQIGTATPLPTRSPTATMSPQTPRPTRTPRTPTRP